LFQLQTNQFRALCSEIPNNFTEHQVMSVFHRAPLWRMRLRPYHRKQWKPYVTIKLLFRWSNVN